MTAGLSLVAAATNSSAVETTIFLPPWPPVVTPMGLSFAKPSISNEEPVSLATRDPRLQSPSGEATAKAASWQTRIFFKSIVNWIQLTGQRGESSGNRRAFRKPLQKRIISVWYK